MNNLKIYNAFLAPFETHKIEMNSCIIDPLFHFLVLSLVRVVKIAVSTVLEFCPTFVLYGYL